MKRSSKKKENEQILLLGLVGIGLYFLFRKKEKVPIIEAGPISDPRWNEPTEYEKLFWQMDAPAAGQTAIDMTPYGGGSSPGFAPADRYAEDFIYYQEVRGDIMNGTRRKRFSGLPAAI